jgi:hypothetical protein
MGSGPGETPEGVVRGPSGKPPQFVAGVIDDGDEFERAIEELTTAGVERESIGVLQGERGAEAIAGRHEHHGLRGWFQHAAESMSDEDEYLNHFQEAARAGGFVIGVPVAQHGGATSERVLEILTRHGAHSLVSSSRWTHTGDA